MSQSTPLAVEIAGDRIIVTMPRTDQQATYCKHPFAPMLDLLDPLRGPLPPSRVAFLAKA
jgi:hypothetical protein